MGAVKILKHFEMPTDEGTHYRLVCLTGEKKGDAYFLTGNRVVMGRSEKADIKIHDIKSSREHAEITKVGKDIVLTDLGSQNGIVVNDLKVKQHVLKNGDKVIIGKTVYKFNEVKVKGKLDTAAKSKKDTIQEDDELEETQEPKSKMTLILGGVILVALVLILDSGDGTKKKSNSSNRYNVQEITDPFTASLKNKQNENKESKQKLNIYFQKGLREFREGNYFRAISEFNHALSWSPNDPLAEFYLRKTKEALDKEIEAYFIKGKRNEGALKYQKAVVQYCAIIRLLINNPEDERYKRGLEGIGRMEEKLGLDEGEIECVKELK